MKNEFGVQMDANDYVPSILDTRGGECYICHARCDTQRHEVFHGSNRYKSKIYGLWVNLCPSCHTKVHGGYGLEPKLKQDAELVALDTYGWGVREFIAHFGKNYV